MPLTVEINVWRLSTRTQTSAIAAPRRRGVGLGQRSCRGRAGAAGSWWPPPVRRRRFAGWYCERGFGASRTCIFVKLAIDWPQGDTEGTGRCAFLRPPTVGSAVVSDWRLQEVHNEMRFRDRNERIPETITDRAEAAWFICSAATRHAPPAISLTHAEYEVIRVRTHELRTRPTSQNPECEVVLGNHERPGREQRFEGLGEHRRCGQIVLAAPGRLGAFLL
jgi:hypothetical protein